MTLYTRGRQFTVGCLVKLKTRGPTISSLTRPRPAETSAFVMLFVGACPTHLISDVNVTLVSPLRIVFDGPHSSDNFNRWWQLKQDDGVDVWVLESCVEHACGESCPA